LGRLLGGGEIIGLTGELGSGKTCFVRGLAQGVDVDKGAWVRSPTFTLINEYDGRVPLFHVDLYRISSMREMEELSLRELLYSEGVSVIEWFERLPEDEVEEYLQINFDHEDGNKRQLTFTSHGVNPDRRCSGILPLMAKSTALICKALTPRLIISIVSS